MMATHYGLAAPVAPPTPPPYVVPKVWDEASKGPNVTITNNGLTASKSSGGAWSLVRANESRPRAAAAEFSTLMSVNGGQGYPGIGFCNAAATMNNYAGVNGNSCMLLSNGQFYYNGTSLSVTYDGSTPLTWTNGQTVKTRIAGQQIYFSVDGGPEASTPLPAELGATIYPCLTLYNAADLVTANFANW
jgi:hypothetical protein